MAGDKRVSLQDIADKAGVSRMTVSLALRNAPKIPKKTRDRIKKIADKLGYHPDPRLTKLHSQIRAAGHSHYHETIAVVYSEEKPGDPKVNLAFFDRVMDGARAQAQNHGFRIEEFLIKKGEMSPKRLKQILVARGISGVIACPLPTVATAFELDITDFSVATIAYSIESPRMNRVCPNHFQAMQLALQKLNSMGFQRIGFIQRGIIEDRIAHKWYSAYLEYQSHLPAKRRLTPLFIDLPELGKIEPWYRKEKPDVILGGFTIQAYKTLIKAGIRVPEDVSYLHLHSTDHTEGMSYIDQNEEVLGEALFNVIFGQWARDEKGEPEHPRTIMVDASWIDGNTVLIPS